MTDPNRLNRAELKALDLHAPDIVREFAAENGRDIAVRTSAYRKIAAAARAEREAITEVHLLTVAKFGGSPAMRMAELERQNAALQASNQALQSRVTRMNALSAMAVNGD